jgi:hypothetical protein
MDLGNRRTMRALLVFESIFGNTRDVAEAIARGLNDAGVDVTRAEVNDAPTELHGFDLIVVGGPTHAWSMSRASTRNDGRAQAAKLDKAPVSKGIGVREWLDRLVPENKDKGEASVAEATASAAAATFDTAVKTRWMPVGSAARAEAKVLRAQGHEIIGDAEHFYVADTGGPLLDGELERARAWGLEIARLQFSRMTRAKMSAADTTA